MMLSRAGGARRPSAVPLAVLSLVVTAFALLFMAGTAGAASHLAEAPEVGAPEVGGLTPTPRTQAPPQPDDILIISSISVSDVTEAGPTGPGGSASEHSPDGHAADGPGRPRDGHRRRRQRCRSPR